MFVDLNLTTEEVVKAVSCLTMSKRTLHIYSVAVLIATLFPVYVQNMGCGKSGLSYIGGKCYRRVSSRVPYTAARENCESFNEQLATFTTKDDMRNVFTKLGVDEKDKVWIGRPNEPHGDGYKLLASLDESKEYFNFMSAECPFINSFICVEMALTTTTRTTQPAPEEHLTTNEHSNLTKATWKETCLHNDSVLIDGQCYHLSTEELILPNAKNYCKDRNETLATISTLAQGIKVIKNLKNYFGSPVIWINYNDEFNVASFYDYLGCQQYDYFNVFTNDESFPALCMELESATTTALTTRPESITTLESTTTPELTTKALANNGAESTSTLSPTPGLATISDLIGNKEGSTTPVGQNQQVNTNRLLHIFRLMTNVRFEARNDFNARVD